MAIFADYWQATPAAYANLKLHSGLASAIAFFTFPLMGDRHIGLVCAGTVAIGIVTYLMAHAIHCRETHSHAHMSGGMYVVLERDDAVHGPGSPRTPSASINDPSAGSVNYLTEEALVQHADLGPGLMLDGSDEEPGSLRPHHSSAAPGNTGSGVSVSIVDRIIILNRPQTPGHDAGMAVGGIMPL